MFFFKYSFLDPFPRFLMDYSSKFLAEKNLTPAPEERKEWVKKYWKKRTVYSGAEIGFKISKNVPENIYLKNPKSILPPFSVNSSKIVLFKSSL